MFRHNEAQSHSWTMRYQYQYLTILSCCPHILAHSRHRSTDLMCLSIDKGPRTCSTWCIEGSGSQHSSHQVGELCRSRPPSSSHHRNQFLLNCTRDRPHLQKQCNWVAFRSKYQAQIRFLALLVVPTPASIQVQGSHWAHQFLLAILRSSRDPVQWCSKAEEAYHLLFCMGCLPTASSTLLQQYWTVHQNPRLPVFSDFFPFLCVVFRTNLRSCGLIILSTLFSFQILMHHSSFAFCTSCRNRYFGCCRIQLRKQWLRWR